MKRKKLLTKLLGLTTCCMLLAASMTTLPHAAAASTHKTIDPAASGTLVIHKYAGTTTDTPLAGVTFSAYKVLGFHYVDGALKAAIEDKFTGFLTDDTDALKALKESLLTFDTAAVSAKLNDFKAYIEQHNVPADVMMNATDGTGTSQATLGTGWYLILETAAPANVVAKSANFFVSMPVTNLSGDAWEYTVTAYPKNQVTSGGGGGGGGGGGTGGGADTDPTPVTPPTTNIPDPNVPTGEPNLTEIEVGDPTVPLTDVPTTVNKPSPNPEVDIVPGRTPKSGFDLPKTGGLTAEVLLWGGPLLMLLALALVHLIGRARRKRT